MQYSRFDKFGPACWCLLGALLLAQPAAAQQTTERFIPIGQSPGISGQLSTIGTLREFDVDSGIMLVDGDDGQKRYLVTPATRIWLDRSASNRNNLVGGREDLAAGSRVEVMHRRDDPDRADWIKIATN